MNQRRAIALRERPARVGKPRRRRTKPLLAVGAGLAALLVIVVAAVVVSTRGGSEGSESAVTAGPSQSVAGVEVVNASVDLGRLPLDKTLTHNFVVRNTNDRTVELGVPAIEVLDGC